MKDEKEKNINNITNLDQKKRKKGNGLIILFIAGFIFLVAFITLVFFLLMKEKGQNDYKEEKYVYTEETPQQVIKSSKEIIKNMKTVKFDGEIKVNALMASKKQNISFDYSSTLDLALAGYIDRVDSDDIKTQFNTDLEIDILSEGGSENISLNMDYIKMQDNFYYKLNDYDLGMMGMMFGSELKKYKGKWFMAEIPDEKDYNSENLDLEKMSEIYAKYKLFKFKEDLGGKKLGNIEVYHYGMELDSSNLANLIEELQSQIEENGHEAENGVKEKLFGRIFENIDIELWIGKKDKFPCKIKVTGNYDTEDFKQIVSKAFGEAEAKKEDDSIKSKISSVERRLKSHYKYTESYDVSSLSYYEEKIKPENVITNKDSYAIWKEMASTTDKWCVDSTGKSGYVLGEIKSPVCPKTSAEPQGEKRDYEKYVYNKFEEEIGSDGKIEVGFDLDLSLSEFNKPLKIEKPKDVEEIEGDNDRSTTNFPLGSGLLSLSKNFSQKRISETDNEEKNEISYKSEDTKDGYVLGESVSTYGEFEKIFELFNFLR